MDNDGPEVQLDAYTAAMRPTERVKADVPPPIARRADQLYELLLGRVHARKGDLLAALIQNAPADPDALRDLLLSYQEKKVHQTLIGERRTKGSTRLPARHRGRPAAS